MDRARQPEDYSELPGKVLQEAKCENEILSAKDKFLLKNFWKECVLISIGFFFLYTGYNPMSAVQSSLNNDNGMGTASLAAKYVSMFLGNLLLSNAIVDRLGCKWTMTIGMILYSIYMAANFYPRWYTLLPAGIFSGIGGSVMYNAQGTYLTTLCDRYILIKHPTADQTQIAKLAKLKAYVFGLLNVFHFASHGIGNLVSSLILPYSQANDSVGDLSLCGSNYCNEILNLTNKERDLSGVYGLSAFCVASGLIGVVIVTFFVDRLSLMGISETQSGNRSIFYLLGATARHWTNPYQLLLIPLGLYAGMDSPFWSSEFSHAFVTCPLGIHYVGYAMMFYGFTVPVFVFLFSLLNKRHNRYIPYCIALLVHIAVLVTLLQWDPEENDIGIVYGLSVSWGLGTGCFYPMILAFYSIIFRKNKEAGFSNFHLWCNLGSALTYATSYSLCVSYKIYMMLGILILGVFGYFIVELHMFLTHRQDGDLAGCGIGQPKIANKPDAEVNEVAASESVQRDLAMKTTRNPEDYEQLPDGNVDKGLQGAEDEEAKNDFLMKNFWKECILISLSFMFLFMGYYPVSAVQSSLNNDDGLGTAALAAKYASMAFGNLLLNNAIVDRLGCKWTLAVGMLMYSSYIAANFYPQWYTLLPFGILSGIGGSAMWNAQGTYLTRLCDRYILFKHPTPGEKQSAALAKLKSYVFGLFNILYFGSNGLGNLASSLILPQRQANSSVDLDLCGAEYCNEILNSTSADVDSAHVYGLSGFCIISALIGVAILTFFVDQLSMLGITETISGNRSVFYLLGATVRHWANPYQLLLIPLGLYNGMDNPFWSSEYTHAFVTCPIGIHYVGYAMMFYGFTVPIFIFLFSFFNKRHTRFIPYLIAFLANIGVLVTLLKWHPTEDDIGIVYGLSVVWGLGSGCWYPMMASFYSITFRVNKEAGFSNFHLWSTLGSALNYAWSHALCVDVKIYIMIGIVSVGVVCYLAIELHMFVTHRQDGDIMMCGQGQNPVPEISRSKEGSIKSNELTNDERY